MKIIDSCITCGKHEIDLLWLKLHLETEVDEFILIENRYDYHGRDKGYWLRDVMKEPMFLEFLGRVKIVELDKKFSDPSEEGRLDPGSYANAEWELRDASTQYILDKYSDEDRVFSSDVDEMIDFTDERRKDRLMRELKTDDPIQFDRVRYWLDYDMRSFRSFCDMVTPAFKVAHLKSGAAKLRDKKWVGRQVGNENNPLIFEYCNCFPLEGHYTKYFSSLHTQWVKHKIDEACQTGTWAKTGYQGPPNKGTRWDWFLRVKLHKNNSPLYVRENLAQLKTNLVPENYVENRIKLYGFDGNFAENQDFPEE